MVHQTAGSKYLELQKQKQDKNTVFEMTEAMTGDYIPSLVALVESDKLKTNKDFYVEVCYRRNQLMPKLIETRMKSRHTCPTPFFDRSVFRYVRNDDKLVYLWTIPDSMTCQELIDNALFLSPEDKTLLQHVIDFRDGTLLHLARTLNGEVNDYNLDFYRKDDDGKRITSA